MVVTGGVVGGGGRGQTTGLSLKYAWYLVYILLLIVKVAYYQ